MMMMVGLMIIVLMLLVVDEGIRTVKVWRLRIIVMLRLIDSVI